MVVRRPGSAGGQTRAFCLFGAIAPFFSPRILAQIILWVTKQQELQIAFFLEDADGVLKPR